MKAQIATHVLGERGYMQFRLHIHDDLRVEQLGAQEDLREKLRNNLYAHLKRRLGEVPWFFLVMEDRTAAGEITRPHAHGSIEIRPAALGASPKKLPARLRRVLAREGRAAAELEHGRELIREALKAASGNAGDRPRFANASGLDQCRNFWWRRPYRPLFNSEYVDYQFKNDRRVSTSLEDNRLVLPYGLRQESKRLWTLVREGESAVSLWD